MAKKKSTNSENGRKDHPKTQPRSLAYFERGITTDIEFAATSIAVAYDLVAGAITASVGNAVRGTLGNVLKVIELKHKYGKAVQVDGDKTLRLN
jgi:hypothetical protein